MSCRRVASALLCFALGLAFPPGHLSAQASAADSADQLARHAQELAAQEQPDSLQAAITLYRQADALHARERNPAKRVEVLNHLIELYYGTQRQDSALAYLWILLPIQRELGDRSGEAETLGNIAALYEEVGKIDSAFLYYAEGITLARSTGNRETEAIGLQNLGLLQFMNGRPDSGLANTRIAAAMLHDLGQRQGEVQALNNIGIFFGELGRWDSAMAYYQAILPVVRELNDRLGEARTLNNIATVFGFWQPDSSAFYLNAALPIWREQHGIRGEAHTLGSLGALLETAGHRDSALVYYRMALGLRVQAGDPRGVAIAQDVVGHLFALLDNRDSALFYYDRALATRREINDRPGILATQTNLGSFYLDSSYRNPRVAAAYFDSAAALSATIRLAAGEEANRLSYAEQQRGLFASWARAWLATADSANPEPSILAALAAVERGRAQALLELMRQDAAGLKVDLTLPGGSLETEGAALVARLRRTRTAALSYQTARDTLIIFGLLPDGRLRVYRKAIKSDSLSRLVYRLRAGLGADSARSAMIRGGTDPEDPEMPRGLPAAGLAPAATTLQSLADIILPAEFLSGLPAGAELVIVPQGAIGLVPFAALPTGTSSVPLGIRNPLRHTPSLAVLGAVEDRPGLPAGSRRRETLRQALVIGNPAMPQVRDPFGNAVTLMPLQGAELEGRRVAQAIGVPALRGADASETAVRHALGTAPLVHLATHGLAYGTEARARQSFIALAPDSSNDGLLTVGELLEDDSLRIAADLVVLSACQTGLGDLRQAEGTVGLQRAFLAKGARSVLVSLWSVDDAATQLIMERFYHHWLKDRGGVTKALALQRAQEDVRRRPGYQNPRFWAAFQLVGAN